MTATRHHREPGMKYGYARVSTGDQHPEAQAERLTAAGCAEVHTDKGVSGSQARRPKWDRLLAKLQRGDELYCTKLDRIGRSVAHLMEIVGRLNEAGVRLVVLDQPIDTGNSLGRLVFHVLAAIAEFERDLIIDRTRDGQAVVRRAANMRRSLGGPPLLGFRDSGGDDWEIDPAAAAWLADAAARVLDGDEVEAVHGILPEITDATGRPVTAKMLRAALQRPASAGQIVIGGELIGAAAIGGPLDEPTFNRLKVLFGARRRGRPAVTDASGAVRFPFGPLLRCGRCGNQLSGQPGYQGRDYYACKNPHKALGVDRPCRGCSVAAADVHALIAGFIAQWAQTPAAQRATARVPQTAGRRAELEADLADLAERLADLDGKRLRLRQQSVRAKYDALAAEAEALIAADEAELAELDRVDAEPGVPPVIDWDAMTVTEKRRTLEEAVVTPIAVEPGNGGGAARSAAERVILLPRTG